ncbi:hypothetical protein [Nocardia lasii]|uniref:DUF222 domain-containing protein n=1 Tax=Nocardia lasii TaxID=1616107 RepID=A0ABW1JNJ7_9NOCA
MREPEVMIDAARGDVGLSRQLGDALKFLAANTTDVDLKQQIGEISAGRASLHSLMLCDGFNALVDPAVQGVGQELAAKSETELRALAAGGEAVLERYRNIVPEPDSTPVADFERDELGRTGYFTGETDSRPVVPGTRKPNRDRLVGPSDDFDEDDRYFRDANDRGWLV